jgi:hypothetical protein
MRRRLKHIAVLIVYYDATNLLPSSSHYSRGGRCMAATASR